MQKFSNFFSKTGRLIEKQILPVVKQGVVVVGKVVTGSIGFLFDHSSQIWTGIKVVGGIILLFVSWPLLLALIVLRFFFAKGTPNDVCPKCDSQNLKVVKAGRWNHLMQQNVAIWVPGAKISKPLNVCRDCGFSWDSR